ncbi:helix-turn-helix transcriptional regulator [uncultured Paraglaciecola sp.]|uniref:helix-turn-helix domain-containing protein n=1 Tax=uncultured Paraglaciecola sp. TaxID=1765024 RepID=UPI00260ECB58|nr:helix-turn-helix transcriptional regulator [uncultured Paraglaciecola sp.]
MNTQSLIHTAQRNGLTQTQIAFHAGVSQPTVHRILSGEFVRHEVEQRVLNWLESHVPVEFMGEVFMVRGEA